MHFNRRYRQYLQIPTGTGNGTTRYFTSYPSGYCWVPKFIVGYDLSFTIYTVLNISPINKSEILSTKDQTQYEEYPNLCTSDSPAKNDTEEIEVCGRRIVNIFNLFEEIKNIDNHEPFDCSFKNMIVIGKKRIVFKSIFTFKCSMCQIKKTVGTENNVFMPINTSAVIGVLNIGCGYSQLQECLSAMEVPAIHIKTYQA